MRYEGRFLVRSVERQSEVTKKAAVTINESITNDEC